VLGQPHAAQRCRALLRDLYAMLVSCPLVLALPRRDQTRYAVRGRVARDGEALGIASIHGIGAPHTPAVCRGRTPRARGACRTPSAPRQHGGARLWLVLAWRRRMGKGRAALGGRPRAGRRGKARGCIYAALSHRCLAEAQDANRMVEHPWLAGLNVPVFGHVRQHPIVHPASHKTSAPGLYMQRL
jgi:hypothetical protein